MIQMVVKMCAVMNVPIEQSEFYRTVTELYGKDTADRLTYEVVVPPMEESECTTLSLK